MFIFCMKNVTLLSTVQRPELSAIRQYELQFMSVKICENVIEPYLASGLPSCQRRVAERDCGYCCVYPSVVHNGLLFSSE